MKWSLDAYRLLCSALCFLMAETRTVVNVPPQPGALQAAVDAAAVSGIASSTTLSLNAGIHNLEHTLTLNHSHAGLHITGGALTHHAASSWASVPASSAVISGGILISKGWTKLPASASLNIWTAPLSFPSYPPRLRAATFRTVRCGVELAVPARYPDADQPGEQPYLGGKFLFVENVTSISYHPYIDGLLINFTIPKAGLPVGWEQWDWRRVEMMVWPGESWINMRSPVTPLLAASAADGSGAAHFQAQCRWCGALNKNAADGIRPNSRFYFFGSPDFISTAREWAVAGSDDAPELWLAAGSNPAADVNDAYPASHSSPSASFPPARPPPPSSPPLPPADVHVAALASPLLQLQDGADNIVIAGIGITDADYAASGNQDNFDVKVNSHGSPADGALAVSNSTNVTVANASFFALGGGGVLLANMSAGCTIASSQFVGIGQSGVMFVGNGTTQPNRCAVKNNTMLRVGSVLHSSAGIFITTASEVEVLWNTIDTVPRWGIAVRSNQNAASANVHVEWNTVRNAMLATKDGGGISFVDHTSTHTVQGGRVANNCVRNVLGVDTLGADNPLPPPGPHSKYGGRLRVGWCSYGVYLDDHTSHVEVMGNVLVQTGGPSLVIHGGSNNTIVNNVFANASNPPGLDHVVTNGKVHRDPWGMLYMDASFGPTTLDANSTGNAVRQNIFLYAAAGGDEVQQSSKTFSGSGSSSSSSSGSNNVTIVGSAVPLSPFVAEKEFGGGVRSNWYYNVANGNGRPLFSSTAPQFFNYTFAEWQQQLKFDVEGTSYQGKDPMFIAARTSGSAPGDWRLQQDSPAAALIGFQPPGIYEC